MRVAHKAVWAVLALSLTACHANLTPVANVAQLGTQVEQSIDTILKTAQAAQASGLLSRAQLDQVALVADAAGRDGQSLANELTQYDALRNAGGSTTAMAASIQALVAAMTAQLHTINVHVPNGTVQQLDAAVAQALSILAEIQAGVL